MKINFFLIIFLFLISCSENKKEVHEIKLYENIGKYFSNEQLNKYYFEGELSSKNLKYSFLVIYNSEKIFKNNEFDKVQVAWNNNDNKIHYVGQIKHIKLSEFKCDKLREEVTNQFKVTQKINLNNSDIKLEKVKLRDKNNTYSDHHKYKFIKDDYNFNLSCYDYTKTNFTHLQNYNYEFRADRITVELGNWIAEKTKTKRIN